jgi:hypothetical protein
MKNIIKEYIVPSDINYIKKNIKNIANQLGYNSVRYVGQGNFGLAYDVGDGKLLKITTDRSEAINANKLRQKPMTKHIINYYDVRRIKTPKDKKYYSIVMDKVSPLNSDYSFYSGIYKIFLNPDISDKDTFDYVFDYLERYKSEEEFDELLSFYKTKLQSQRQSILKEFKKYGVPVLDAHSNNVGFDIDGNFVFFDIGLQSMRGSMGKILKPITMKEWDIKKIKHNFKETEKVTIYNKKEDMKTIKLSESDLTNIVKRIVNEASEPRIKGTVEPPERNSYKSDFVPTPKTEISIYDKKMMRAEITQKVVDRIIKYDEMYLKELKKLNSKFPIKKDRFGQY